MDLSEIKNLSDTQTVELLDAIFQHKTNIALSVFGAIKNQKDICLWAFIDRVEITQSGNIELIGNYYRNSYSDYHFLELKHLNT